MLIVFKGNEEFAGAPTVLGTLATCVAGVPERPGAQTMLVRLVNSMISEI